MIILKFLRAVREIAQMFSCAIFDRVILSLDEIFLILFVQNFFNFIFVVFLHLIMKDVLYKRI